MQKASISARYTHLAAAAVCSNEVVQCFLSAIFHPPLMFDTERTTGVWHKRCTRNANEWNNSAKAQNMASACKKKAHHTLRECLELGCWEPYELVRWLFSLSGNQGTGRHQVRPAVLARCLPVGPFHTTNTSISGLWVATNKQNHQTYIHTYTLTLWRTPTRDADRCMFETCVSHENASQATTKQAFLLTGMRYVALKNHLLLHFS